MALHTHGEGKKSDTKRIFVSDLKLRLCFIHFLQMITLPNLEKLKRQIPKPKSHRRRFRRTRWVWESVLGASLRPASLPEQMQALRSVAQPAFSGWLCPLVAMGACTGGGKGVRHTVVVKPSPLSAGWSLSFLTYEIGTAARLPRGSIETSHTVGTQ